MDLKYFWEQEFPAQQLITVEHTYRSGAGSGFPENLEKTYCFDDAFEKALENKKRSLKAQFKKDEALRKEYGTEDNYVKVYLHFHTRLVSYILKTGANWSGPIKKFNMTLDKESPENLVATCWRGFKKASPSKLEYTATHFLPTENIQILFVTQRGWQPL